LFDTERAKQDLPEIEIVAFCQQMPAPLRKKLGYQPDGAWRIPKSARFPFTSPAF
jgi:hypothetical protein